MPATISILLLLNQNSCDKNQELFFKHSKDRRVQIIWDKNILMWADDLLLISLGEVPQGKYKFEGIIIKLYWQVPGVRSSLGEIKDFE